MRASHLLLGSIVTFGVLSAAGLTAMKTAQPGAAAMPATEATESMRFNVDPVHTSVIFRIEHLGVAPFYGRFNEVNGSMEWNKDQPENSSINITIKADSVDTNNERRDAHLRSPDFFTVREHPEISFRSTGFEANGSDKYKVTGDLTLHGVTKSKTIELHRIGARPHPQRGNEIVGFETSFTIKRSDFNMEWGIDNGMLGDEVKLLIGIEGISE